MLRGTRRDKDFVFVNVSDKDENLSNLSWLLKYEAEYFGFLFVVFLLFFRLRYVNANVNDKRKDSSVYGY